MWDEARKIVDDIFFKDEIELFKNTIVVDSLGEEHEVEELVGTYRCNLQYEPATVKADVGGRDFTQLLRISLEKNIVLDYSFTYKIKIKSARIRFDNRYWEIENWKESQISTVIIASRVVMI